MAVLYDPYGAVLFGDEKTRIARGIGHGKRARETADKELEPEVLGGHSISANQWRTRIDDDRIAVAVEGGIDGAAVCCLGVVTTACRKEHGQNQVMKSHRPRV